MSAADVNAEIAQLNAAGDQDEHDQYVKASEAVTGKPADNPVANWVRSVPKNVTVGVMDAGIALAHATNSFGDWLDNNVKEKERAAREQGVEGGPPQPTAQELREQALATPMMQDHHAAVLPAVMSFRDEMARGSSTSDQITQSIAQYSVPFLGFSKLIGGLQGTSLLGTVLRTGAAEAATTGTALEPHAARGADLLEMGRNVEGKFGDALHTIAPDGSALNAYINYMTDRSGESDAEGRFKNIVDNLGLSAAATGLIKVTAGTLKGGLEVARYAAENAGTGPVGLRAQEGKIVFHGTPHDFNEFDSEKIGTGEGNQSFGHGLYFAESPDTAGSYRAKLVQRNVKPGSHTDLALQAMQDSGGDSRAAYGSLLDRAGKTSDADEAFKLRAAAGIVRAGNAGKRGALMHVDIPDEKIGQMLDHDKLMQHQANVLDKIPVEDKAQMERMLGDFGQHEQLEGYTGNQFRQIVRRAISEDYLSFTPKDGKFDNAEKNAAEYLSEHGVPGIKYFDRASRNNGDGTRNIVLFDAKHAKIVKKD